MMQKSEQAPFGLGEKTIIDTNVRRVWQIDPKHIKIKNPEWKDYMNKLCGHIKKDFVITKNIKCEFYKSLIYEKGSFFKPYKDSEKEDGMFATLIICLPCEHKGGELIIEHDGLSGAI